MPSNGLQAVFMQWILFLLIAAATFATARAESAPAASAERDAASDAELLRYACPAAPGVVVRSAAATDARTVCEGVERALTFLDRAGLAAPPGTHIEIVSRLPGELGGRAVGCYQVETRSIQLLSYDAFEAIDRWFRTPVDRELYRAVAAHEMAHAVVGWCGATRRLPTAAHEYVAYVVLFATMDPGLRERVLAKFPGTGFTSTLQINDVAHIADPNQFGVDAWRHYLRRPDRAAWLREVIAGNVVPEFPKEGP